MGNCCQQESAENSRTAVGKAAYRQTSSTFPLTISVLNRIFDFAAADARDAILRLGLVNQQWKDTLLYAPAMWYRICEEKWPQKDKSKTASATSVNRWSMQSYKMRTISNLRPHHGATDFADIENCVASDFQFICPLVAQNLRVLHDEVDAKNGMNIMFCDVCEKKVFPVTTQEELREAGAEQRCVIIPAEVREILLKSNVMTNTPTFEIINVAIAVSKPNHYFDRNDLALSNERDLGVVTLKKIFNYFQAKIKTEAPSSVSTTSSRWYIDFTPRAHNIQMGHFNSRNSLTIFLDRPAKKFVLNFRVVYVNPARAVDAKGKKVPARKFTTQDHPGWDGVLRGAAGIAPIMSPAANDDSINANTDLSNLESTNPLGVMPSNGGFQYIFGADVEASRWFVDPGLSQLIRGSPMYALTRPQARKSFLVVPHLTLKEKRTAVDGELSLMLETLRAAYMPETMNFDFTMHSFGGMY